MGPPVYRSLEAPPDDKSPKAPGCSLKLRAEALQVDTLAGELLKDAGSWMAYSRSLPGGLLRVSG